MENTRYMISDASNIVNVEAHVLRYWEDELSLDVPRNEMGHRYYTKENIEQFLKIKELKEKGYQLKAIKMVLQSDQPQNFSPNQEESMKMDYIPQGNQGFGRQMDMNQIPMDNQGNVRGLSSRSYQNVTRNENDSIEKMNQFRKMMSDIVQDAVKENNDLLKEEVLDKVGDRVLKEMNYLMREQEEQENERYLKLDTAIRNALPPEKKSKAFFKKKKKEKEPKTLLIRKTAT